MDTSLVILLVVSLLLVFGVAGYFVYKYFLEPRMHQYMNHNVSHAAEHMAGHAAEHLAGHIKGGKQLLEGGKHLMSMAGHLSHKMANAKSHTNEAVKGIQHAKHHLNQAHMHVKS